MNRNILVIALVFLVPIAAYWGLSRNKSVGVIPAVAAQGPEIIKFSSPMCYECQELEKVFEEVYPQYANKISLNKIDVTSGDSRTKKLIKEYEVKLVPTTVFKNSGGEIVRREEGLIQSKILENYFKEIINE